MSEMSEMSEFQESSQDAAMDTPDSVETPTAEEFGQLLEPSPTGKGGGKGG